MIRTQIQLSEAQMRALRRLAAARERSLAELVREGVDLLLRSSGGVDPEERKNRALAAAGRFRSGTADLSSEHDRYLAEAYKE